MHTQAATAKLGLKDRARPGPEPYTVVLAGRGLSSWACGLHLAAHTPIAVLRAETFAEGYVIAGGERERWRGAPFELFERFVAQLFGSHGSNGLHIVVAIPYDTGLPLQGIAPRWEPRGPWLVAAAYASASATVTSAVAPPTTQRTVAGRTPGRRAAARQRHTMLQATWPASEYERAVRRVQDYIAAGDVYQVNLAYPLRAPMRAALPLFSALQRHNPVPFGAYFHGGDFELVCNSPESFLSRRGRTVTTRPIKGTRRRGLTPAEDAALVAELRQDPKERAELTMIVDLERNDLGRICDTGSVQVPAHERVETFATLHHLVSEVRGRLRPDVGWAEILSAMFPGGSVTGAPKRRAMQIIAELEPGPRRFYTGALGWLRSAEEADFALLIRTAVADASGVEYWTGGGIVADSIVEREYQETLLKARAFVAALEEAE